MKTFRQNLGIGLPNIWTNNTLTWFLNPYMTILTKNNLDTNPKIRVTHWGGGGSENPLNYVTSFLNGP